MPAPPAKRRPRRRQPATDADPLRRLLVKCDERGQPVCDGDGRPIFWVTGNDGRLRRLVLPPDSDRKFRILGEGDGPPDDLPAPLKIKTGKRGQPPKTPTGTWEDHPELAKAIEDILDDADDRADRLTEIHAALCRLAREFLGPERFAENECEKVLKSLARKTIRPAGTSLPARVGSDEIERQFLVWRYNLTDPAVRKIRLPRNPKPVSHDFTALVLKYDDQGQPVCDEQGQPILWLPDEHGQPSRPYGVLGEHGRPRPYVAGEPLPRRRVKTVPPRVKMIFR